MKTILHIVAVFFFSAQLLSSQSASQTAAMLSGFQQAAAQRTAPGPARVTPLRGRVTDSSGAVIPGAGVRVVQSGSTVAEGETDANGSFDFQIAPGDYVLSINLADFSPYTRTVRVAPGMSPLTVGLTLAGIAQSVDVNDAVVQDVNIDAETGLTATTISGDDLADLPDNEDDLAAYLLRLAGLSGAPGGQASFVIDGFNGGRLPPKDQIQQIIIDNNPFTAEGNGGTRITIITRPGTSKWTGQFGGNLNSSTFNATTPASLTKPDRKVKTFNSSLGGTMIPGILNITFTGQYIQTDAEGNAIRAVLPAGQSVNQAILSPGARRNLGARGQLLLTARNTLNFNATLGANDANNQGTGGLNLAERAFDSLIRNWQIQISEMAIPTPRIINEFRFQAGANKATTASITNAVAVNVTGAFNGGGAQNDNLSRSHTYDLANTVRWTVNPKLNLQSGVETVYEKRRSEWRNNFLGAYTFASLEDYVAGRPQTFTRTFGNPLLNSNQYDFTGFAQADWRATPRITVGLGARYTAQSNLHDYNNLAPTASIGLQVAEKTVIRAGTRLSYQTFSLNNTETILRNSGANGQTTINIAFPTYAPGQPPPEAALTVPNTGSIYVRPPSLQAPYNINSLLSLDHALPGGWRFGASADMTRGNHLIRTRNINAPFPGTALSPDLLARLNSADGAVRTSARAEVDRLRPLYPLVGNLYQFESSAESFSRNFTLRLFTPAAGLPGTPGTLYIGHFGFGGSLSYSRGYSNDNLGFAPNPYDFSTEWARSANEQRNRVQGQFQMRPTATVGLMTFNVTAASGRPYSVTTGRDDNGDQSSTDRPVGVGRNTLTSPRTYNVDLVWVKIKTLTSGSRTTVKASDGDTPPPQGSGTTVGRVNFSGPRITWNFSVRNLLNNTQVRTVNGVETSPLFGRALTFAAGRSITAGLSFSF